MPTQVNITTPGIISITGVPAIYSDSQRYVMQKTDFGFLWLDTVAYTAGLVQVEAKCGVGQPSTATNVYVTGDCNGITNLSSSGTVVLARQLSGQCGAATAGCGGPVINGTGFFKFTVGTWAFLGQFDPVPMNDIPDGTMTTDSAGRTWQAQPDPTALDGKHFIWTTTATPTPPPGPPLLPAGVVEGPLITTSNPQPGNTIRSDFLLLQDTPPLHAVVIYFVAISQTGTRVMDITTCPNVVFPTGIHL